MFYTSVIMLRKNNAEKNAYEMFEKIEGSKSEILDSISGMPLFLRRLVLSF